MKKLLLSASIIFLFAGAIKAQMPLTLGHQWTKAFPATNYQTEQAASVVTPDGHLVSVTNYRYNIDVDPNPDSTVVVTGASSFYSGVISIMDSNENYQAHLNFANTQETKIVDIATDSDNNIYALGYTSANISIGTVNPITLTITSASYFLVKLSTNGNPLWAYKTTAKLNTITVGDVNGSERLFVGGYAFKGTNTDIKNASGAGLFNSGSNGVAYPIMVSYDTACNYVSFNYINLQNNFSSPYGEINSITLKNNNLYLAGQFSEIFSISSIGVNITSKGGDDGFVAKYNAATLQPIWAKRVGSHAQDYIKTIDVDNNENVYLSGEFSGGGFNFDPVATGTTNVTGAYDAFLIKLDSSGVFSWGRHFYGSNTSSEKLNSIAVTGDGDVFMTGQARLLINMKDHNGNLITTINPTASNTNNALDIYLYRLNTNGGLEMSTHIGGTVGGYNSPSTPPNYEAGTHLNIHGGYLYLSANTTIANRLDAQKIDFNPAPFTINGLTDYLSNINETITATLTKYFVCTDNSSVSFLSSIVSTCPNNYLQYIPNPNNSNYSYQWNCSSLGISSDSAILKIANPSAALGGKVMNLQMTDVNGCYKHVYAPIDGSALSAPSVSLTSSITDLCNGDTYTCTATGSNVKWYANATDTIPVASGNTYSYTPVLQQTTAMAIYAATTNTVTGCEDPRAVHSFTVGVIPQTYIDSTQSGPFVGCANGQSRYVQVITPLNLFAKIYPDSLSNTQIGFTNSWWDLGSHYDLTIPDTITVWIETEGTIGQPSIPCGSIRFPLTFILNDCSVTAISESSINSNVFKIYPNPANDVITINYDGLKETNSSIEIINTVGQTLIKQDVANETSQNINVSNLSNGIYFVQIKQNGKSIATKKLVINK